MRVDRRARFVFENIYIINAFRDLITFRDSTRYTEIEFNNKTICWSLVRLLGVCVVAFFSIVCSELLSIARIYVNRQFNAIIHNRSKVCCNPWRICVCILNAHCHMSCRCRRCSCRTTLLMHIFIILTLVSYN